MKVAKAATGSRNYNMGMSKAPTRGKVNPSGYIQREVRNRNQQAVGRDGQSDRRSGLAQAALKNAGRYAGKPQNPKMGARPVGVRPGGRSANIKIGTPGFKDIKIGTPGFEDIKVGTPEGMGQPQIPNVRINNNGQLDLPFDEAFGLGLVEQQQEMNSELMGLQGEEQAQAMDFANQQRDLGLQFEDVKRNTLNGNAAGGTAFSSQYAVGASDNSRNFNNALNDLNAWNTQTMSGFGNQRMGIQNAFNDYVRQAVLRRSMDLAAEAGDLGYGQDAPNADWWGKAPKKYPAKAQHNKSTLKKSTAPKKSSSNSKTPKKSSPIKKLKKR
jgi:hypothetical protein